MKKWGSVALALVLGAIFADATAQVRVSGYTRKDGTYVAPHYRSSPNSSKHDNYSAKGNYNPYTGKKGSVDPYSQPYRAPSYYSPAPAYSSRPPVYYSQPRAHVPESLAPPYIPPTISLGAPSLLPEQGADTDAEEGAYTAAEAKEALNQLGYRLQSSDPFWELRYPQIVQQMADIDRKYPPSRWVEEVERAYWNIPASKTMQRPTSSSLVLAQRRSLSSHTCNDAEATREALERAAMELAYCARKRDYEDDCSIEASDVRDAADDYESAISDIGGDCY